ncbi:S-adenosyl-L-methionine-dependent methyltransferase [Xylariomycetidae sp. FL0641]|nr:S-adenosyl-L-methionine-dependent methyltransferase [Xylariomycetidae sp. FL0641]
MGDRISELLSRRGGRGGLSSRKGRGQNQDAIIQSTDNDAAEFRMSAAKLGYINDPFAQFFVQHPVQQKQPMINRDKLISTFLSRTEGQVRQIISLGAGTDTRCFKLFSQPSLSNIVYHEIDFPAVASKKRQLVNSAPSLRSILPNIELKGETWSSHHLLNGCQYWCHGMDLRDILKENFSGIAGIRPDPPTLLISECCLCYLEVAEANKIVKYFVDRLPKLSMVIYEPIHPNDAFGKQMASNLEQIRHIRMPTVKEFPENRDQETRLQNAGFPSAKCITIEKLWEKWIPPKEKDRLDNLERLDEVEEWNLMADHYAIVWGWKDAGLEGWDQGL